MTSELDREFQYLDDRVVQLKYHGARSIIVAVGILVLIPFYFTQWGWPPLLGSSMGIYSMVSGWRINKERKQTDKIQANLK